MGGVFIWHIIFSAFQVQLSYNNSISRNWSFWRNNKCFIQESNILVVGLRNLCLSVKTKFFFTDLLLLAKGWTQIRILKHSKDSSFNLYILPFHGRTYTCKYVTHFTLSTSRVNIYNFMSRVSLYLRWFNIQRNTEIRYQLKGQPLSWSRQRAIFNFILEHSSMIPMWMWQYVVQLWNIDNICQRSKHFKEQLSHWPRFAR